MNHQTSQIGSLSALEHMIALGDLNGNLKAFLLSCKVDELSPATLKDYDQKIGAFVRHCSEINISRPGDVNVSHVRMFLLKLQERCSPHSVHDYYGCVKRFFNWLVSEGMLPANPMANMRSPRVPQRIIRPFTAEHIRDLLLLCDESKFLGVRNRAIILTFVDTGLRLSELAGIQLKEIDFDRGLIKVMGKGSKERVVGIGKGAQKAILRYLLTRHDNYSCLWVTEEARPMQARGIQIMIRRLGKRAGITGARPSPHTFRHTFGTCAMLNGASEREVQLLLGHSSDRMTKRYTATITSENVVGRHSQFSPVDKMELK
ncbi:Tyrosine recombinase XerC [subsurface metagenome]